MCGHESFGTFHCQMELHFVIDMANFTNFLGHSTICTRDMDGQMHR